MPPIMAINGHVCVTDWGLSRGWQRHVRHFRHERLDMHSSRPLFKPDVKMGMYQTQHKWLQLALDKLLYKAQTTMNWLLGPNYLAYNNYLTYHVPSIYII